MTNENEKLVDIMAGYKIAVVSSEDSYIFGLIKKTIESLTSADVQYVKTIYYNAVIIDYKTLELDNIYGDVVLYGIVCTAYAHGYKAKINGYYGHSFLKAVSLLMGEDD